MRPNYSVPFGSELDSEQRVEKVLNWLELPVAVRPRFISLYLSEVDSAGHESGPFSQAVFDAVVRVDGALGKLVDGLSKRTGEHEEVNIVIVSDHGMAETAPERTIYLEDFIDIVHDAMVISWGPFTTIRALHGRTSALLFELRTIEHVSVSQPTTISPDWHYSNHPRIADLLLTAEEGWTITSRARAAQNPADLGGHGYDPRLASMSAFLLGVGDFFTPDLTVPYQSENIHLYSLLARLLEVPPAPNSGSWLALCPFLNKQC